MFTAAMPQRLPYRLQRPLVRLKLALDLRTSRELAGAALDVCENQCNLP